MAQGPIELSENISVVCDPSLKCTDLTLLGVRIGNPATSIPRGAILEATFTPYGFCKPASETPQAIDWALSNSGWLHCGDKHFRVVDGIVVQFSLDASELVVFEIRSPSEIIERFGTPDAVLETRIHNDLVGIDYWYERSQKELMWNCGESRLSLIAIGKPMKLEPWRAGGTGGQE